MSGVTPGNDARKRRPETTPGGCTGSDEEYQMKNRRRLAIILTYAAAVFLSAKAQAGAAELTTQITLAALYLGPAVILHFVINWIWGDEKPDQPEE